MYKKNLVFAAACLGMLLFGIVFLSLGSVVNLLREKFNLDSSGIGTLTALLPLGILGGSIVFGPVVDRYGYKFLLIICSFLVLIGLEGIAFANEITWIQVCIVLIGFGGGILNGTTNALVADISEGERGARLSLLGVFFGIGALGMPVVLATLSKQFSDEQIVSGVGFFIVLPILYFVATKFPPAKQVRNSSMRENLALLKQPLLLLLGLVLAFQSGMEGMTNDWTPVLFAEKFDATKQEPLYALTSFVAALTVTRLLLGSLLKRIASPIVLFASLGFSMAGSMTIMLGTSYSAAICGAILLGIGLSACFPVVLGYIGDLYSKNSGTAFSIVFVIALLGNMTMNKTMGYIAQQHGIEQFTKVLVASLVAVTILLIFVIQRINKTNPNIIKIK